MLLLSTVYDLDAEGHKFWIRLDERGGRPRGARLFCD